LVSTDSPEAVERIAAKNKIECVRLGVTMKEQLRITLVNGESSKTLACPVRQLTEVWENALEGMLEPVHV
jgi:hypothetical protein